MSRLAYVNCRYVPHRSASVHVEDRGYQFSDGVYEVFAVYGGRIIDEDRHLDRLRYSLSEVRMVSPILVSALRVVLRQIIEANRITAFGSLYLQITRGVAPRNHAFPRSGKSSIVVTGRRLPAINAEEWRQGIAVIALPDLRWLRRDIKSISLLPNVLAKQSAVDAGAYECWLLEDDETVTEGTTSNAWIVSGENEIATHPANHSILNGITRLAVIDVARDLGIRVREVPFSLSEARSASEAFLTSTTAMIKPVVRIAGDTLGEGRVGPITERLMEGYLRYIARQTGDVK